MAQTRPMMLCLPGARQPVSGFSRGAYTRSAARFGRISGDRGQPNTVNASNPDTPPSALRRRVFNLLDPQASQRGRGFGRNQEKGSFLVEIGLVAVVAINSTSLILWTVPSFRAGYDGWFHVIEYITVAVFVVEYALRLWSAPEADPYGQAWRLRWRYVISPVALIDLAALAPSALAAALLLVTGGGFSLSFLLAVRLLTRTVKLARYFPGGRRLGVVLRQRGSQLLATAAGLLVLLVIAASLMYFAEKEAQSEVFSSIPAAMWWAIVTLTTVGYGDLVPVTLAGRLLAAIIALLGIGLFALPAGIISAGMLETEMEDAGRDSRPARPTDGEICPHCGQPIPDTGPD